MRMPATIPRPGMRRAAQPQVARVKSRPPPVKGWNTVKALDGMEPEWAVTMDNWFPQPGYVEPRGGYASHSATGNAAAVESLMGYHATMSVNDKLFGAAGTIIYDVTTATAASAVTSLLNARWQHINFTTTGGKFLFIVNGEDDPRHFDGATWATPVITGITASQAIHVNAHKNRIWLTLVNSTKAAYLPVDSIAGAATTFEFGAVFKRGGFLMATATWTRDAGNGPDDFAVFISSEGDIAVYQGTDPASATTWSLVGVFEVGAPIGRRCFTEVGSDLAIITIDGVLPMSLIPGIERGASARISLTANIQPTVNAAARAGKSLFGWQLTPYPRGTMAIMNVPISTTESQQYVMNTVTGAWARFLDMDARVWETWQDRLFFGGAAGVVYEADKGAQDNGGSITATFKTAFDYMDSRGQLKTWTMLRPKIKSEAQLTPQIAINVDFRDDQQASPALSSLSGVALWDVAVWDVDSWPPEAFYRNEWATVTGLGYCASVAMTVQISGSTSVKAILQLNGIDFMFQPGGFI